MSERMNVRRYKKISRKQRLQLLSLIIEQKNTIKRAAELVGIGASTARMILMKYQKTGDVFESKTDIKTRQIIEKIQQQKNSQFVLPIQPVIQQNIEPVTFVPIFYCIYPTTSTYWPSSQ